MKVRYITAAGVETSEVTKTSPSYKKMSYFLEGYVERFTMLVNVQGYKKPITATVWVNEEGMLLNMPINEVVSKLVVESAALMGARATQKIYGNAIITQPNDKVALLPPKLISKNSN